MAGMLKACIANELSVSQLLATLNISYKVLKPLVEILISNQLLTSRTDHRRRFMQTTDRGLATFKMYAQVLAMFGGSRSINSIPEDFLPETIVNKIKGLPRSP